MMLLQILQKLSDRFEAMSSRERRLAAAVAALMPLFLVYLVANSALGHLDRLDRKIDQLQDDIISYRNQIERRQTVEEQYAGVAAQHSSAWSEAEIMDRLRQELFRLAQNVPPPLGPDGIPVKTVTESGDLVKIPSLQAGRLEDGGEDYREFRLEFRVPKVELTNLINYLERLQDSPQSLRIDGLRLHRSPLDTKVVSEVTISRIVVAGVGGDAGLGDGVGLPMELAKWQGSGCEISRSSEHSTSGMGAVMVEAAEDGSVAFAEESLDSGRSYDLFVDITAFGEGRLSVAHDKGREFPGGQTLRGDGLPHRYHLRFTVPAGGAEETPLRVPAIILTNLGDRVYIDNLAMRGVGT